MKKGTVKWYDPRKRYGFILPEGENKDIFFHQTNIESSDQVLEENTIVEFEITEGKNGKLQAVNIHPVE